MRGTHTQYYRISMVATVNKNCKGKRSDNNADNHQCCAGDYVVASCDAASFFLTSHSQELQEGIYSEYMSMQSSKEHTVQYQAGKKI
jgi:hypothetical protein